MPADPIPAAASSNPDPDPAQPGPILRLLFAAYKHLISPAIHALGVSRCIFLPTCSEYAFLSIARHGWLRGSALALRRIARCHPWNPGGHDPVP